MLVRANGHSSGSRVSFTASGRAGEAAAGPPPATPAPTTATARTRTPVLVRMPLPCALSTDDHRWSRPAAGERSEGAVRFVPGSVVEQAVQAGGQRTVVEHREPLRGPGQRDVE